MMDILYNKHVDTGAAPAHKISHPRYEGVNVVSFCLRPVSTQPNATNCIGDSTEGVAAAAVKQARREEQEVLRTCTKHGARVRVWPAAALPKTPLRPLPLQLPSSPPPPPLHPNRHQDTRIPIPPGYTADDTNPPPRNFENEEKQQGSSETRPSVAHGGSEGT